MGDVMLEGDVILYHGDCLEFLSALPAERVGLVVSSPPYNLGKEYEERQKMEAYLSQQRQVLEECVRVLSPNGSLCWQVGNYVENGAIVPLDILFYPILRGLGLTLRNRIIWHFGHGLHAKRRFSGRYETILWFTKTNDYYFDLDPVRVPQKYPQKKHFKGPNKGKLSGNPLGKNPSDIWEIPNVKANHLEKTIHPCQFPVELIERLVLSLTREGDWVLDPFMGVGSSIIAALMHGRMGLGAEIDSTYYEESINRLELAERGELRVRPKERSIYDPNNPGRRIPPKQVHLQDIQKRLIGGGK